MIRLAFRNLFRHARRTIAILLTVAMGSGALLSFEGFINGVLKDFRSNTIHAHHGYGQINTEGYRESAYEKPWEHWITNWETLSRFLKQQDEVVQLFPRVSFSALLKKGSISVGGHGQGIHGKEEASFFNSLNIEQGSTLTTERDGIILGRGLAHALHAKPGDSVTLMTQATDGSSSKKAFVVTGIFHTGLVDFDSKMFRIQLSEAQKLLKTDRIESIALNIRELSDWQPLEEKIEASFGNLEASSFAELDKVYYQNSVDWLNAQFNIVQMIIIIIVLLGIFNTITTSIMERKQEIGNLRANGESILDVMRLIVYEGMFLGVLGALLGVLITFGAVELILAKGILMPPGPGSTRQFYIRFAFEWQMIVRTVVMSGIAAVIATFLAGLKVSKMTITRALRSY